MSALHLDCLFRHTEFRADLFVEHARDDELKNFELPRCELIDSRSQRIALEALPVTFSRSSKSMVHGTQQRLIVEGLREKIHGACFHGVDRHRNVGMAGYEDDLLVARLTSKRFL